MQLLLRDLVTLALMQHRKGISSSDSSTIERFVKAGLVDVALERGRAPSASDKVGRPTSVFDCTVDAAIELYDAAVEEIAAKSPAETEAFHVSLSH